MRFLFSSKKAWLQAFVVCVALLATAGVAQADWVKFSEQLSEDGAPDKYISASGSGTASVEPTGEYAGSESGGALLYDGIQSSAMASVTQYGYNSRLAHAHMKVRYTFTWEGGGTPTSRDMYFRKAWSVTPASTGSTMVGYYATASFNGVQVTVASDTIGWAYGFTLATSGTTLTYSCGSTAMAGYSYGGSFTTRTSAAQYDWETTDIGVGM